MYTYLCAYVSLDNWKCFLKRNLRNTYSIVPLLWICMAAVPICKHGIVPVLLLWCLCVGDVNVCLLEKLLIITVKGLIGTAVMLYHHQGNIVN